MELTKDRDEWAVRAAEDPAELDAFVRENNGFILRSASRTCKRFITDSDDEYEIALVAFCEAVRTFRAEAGGFYGFAALVIRRRLMDYFDSQRRRAGEISVGSAMTWEDDEEALPSGALRQLQDEIARKSFERERHSVKDEIEALGGVLAGYGFSFFDVADDSPRADKTRGFCRRAVRWMLALPQRIFGMRRRRNLPVKEMSTACELHRKVVERHRKYIITATEVLDGDYPELSEYFRYIKRDEA